MICVIRQCGYRMRCARDACGWRKTAAKRFRLQIEAENCSSPKHLCGLHTQTFVNVCVKESRSVWPLSVDREVHYDHFSLLESETKKQSFLSIIFNRFPFKLGNFELRTCLIMSCPKQAARSRYAC